VRIFRTAPQARFWGKVRNDRVAKTAPAGRPKSDCWKKQADKYGATVAAIAALPGRFLQRKSAKARASGTWFSAG
jgi:hypothetical protein